MSNFTFNEFFVNGFNMTTALLGGGLLSVILLFILGKRIMAEIHLARSSWGNALRSLFAWTIVPIVIIGAGQKIYSEVNRMVTENVNGQSMQAVGDAGNKLTYALDKVVGFAPSDTGGGQSYGGSTQQAAFQIQPLVGGSNTQSASNEPMVESINVPAESPAVPTVEELPDFMGGLLTNASQTSAASVPVTHDWSGYVVKPGDNMTSIARRYGVNVADLCGMNVGVVGSNCSLLKVGATIKLPMAGGEAPKEIVQIAKPVVQTVNSVRVIVQPTPAPAVIKTVAAGGQAYTIQAGDTIYTIANKFGGMSKVYGICAANRATLGDNCDNLQAGAAIVVK